MAVVAGLALSGCGDDATGDTPGSGSRVAAQRRAESRLDQSWRGLDRGFLCVRLPDTGPLVTVLVRQAADQGRAIAELRRLRIRGTVAVRSLTRYGREEDALERTIQARRPPGLRGLDVYEELYSGHLTAESVCPRVRIEVGAKGPKSRAAVTWATEMINTYGSDRLRYAYLTQLHGLVEVCEKRQGGETR
jgi:hypothetical protein